MEAFAKQLTEVRNLDTKGEYAEQLNQLEIEYQFILLRFTRSLPQSYGPL